MYHTRRVAAIVPVKDHSERVPGKNFREFCGKPLYHHILGTLENTYAIDEVIVDTDSPRVMIEAPKLFRKVRIIERPGALQGDSVSVNKLIAHDLDSSDAEIFIQTHATNPLLKPETISAALQAFVDGEERFDSLFSVNRFQSRFYDSDGSPVNHNPAELLRTQDLPPVYEENSIFYVFTKSSFAKHQRRIGEKPKMHETPAMESIDIDDEFKFRMAELLGLYAMSKGD
jgi:CMP-N-acetylneuraminic acid synthetase